MSAVEFIKTKCGARYLLYAGYKYTLNQSQCYWRCQDRADLGEPLLSDENDRLTSASNTNLTK